MHDTGLEKVVVAETRLSEVDGAHGRLILAGYDVEQLVERASFEAAFELLGTGRLPDAETTRSVAEQFGRARARAFECVPRLGAALDPTDAMSALRAAVGALPAPEDGGDALSLVGALPVFAAAWFRRRRGEPLVPPDALRSHAADLLAMLGAEPDSARARALDRYFVTVIDHGLNASTFTARVVASTGSDTTSAVTAAIGALKGPLHGGAPGPVLDMLDAVGAPERARAWLERELDAGHRIMGMGHRVYRVRDPRAAVLERAVETLERAATGALAERLALARAVEREAEALLAARHPERPLRANVEFYTAVLLEAVGLPRELFSATFACARVAGWIAHVNEQRAHGRLIRPASRYVGPRP